MDNRLLKALRPVKRRVRRNRLLQGAAWGLTAGLGAALILRIVALFTPVEGKWLWAAVPVAAFTLLFAAGNALRPVAGRTAAQAADGCGLKERTIFLLHAMRNALIPLVTVVMLDIPAIFSGAVVTETVFAWPGMGSFFNDALSKQDFPLLMGILMINAILVILSNLIADILYAVLDPRIKY